MGDGLEGRRLTGLLTVKRENFPGMREFGWVGGAVRREMLERGPGEEVGRGALGAPGLGVELDGPTGRLWRGHLLPGPAPAPHAPFSAFPCQKEEALGLHSRSPATPPLQTRVRGREVRRGD